MTQEIKVDDSGEVIKDNQEVTINSQLVETKIVSDGGPSKYYDFLSGWKTLNDMMDYKAEKQWKGLSFHMGNVQKAIFRWGNKNGTTVEYDAKKIIYSGCRILLMLTNKATVRKYLQSLLDDEQFK